MRLLVVSDSHGDKYALYEAIEKEPTAEAVIFLGDGYRDLEDAKMVYGYSRAFFAVCGNCDFGCDFPVKMTHRFESQKVYMTHGHWEKVKFGNHELEWRARDEGCSIALYGHTHEPIVTYKDGIHLFNPGALRDGFYGVVDITENGIICINKRLVY